MTNTYERIRGGNSFIYEHGSLIRLPSAKVHFTHASNTSSDVQTTLRCMNTRLRLSTASPVSDKFSYVQFLINKHDPNLTGVLYPKNVRIEQGRVTTDLYWTVSEYASDNTHWIFFTVYVILRGSTLSGCKHWMYIDKNRNRDLNRASFAKNKNRVFLTFDHPPEIKLLARWKGNPLPPTCSKNISRFQTPTLQTTFHPLTHAHTKSAWHAWQVIHTKMEQGRLSSPCCARIFYLTTA